MTKKPMPAAERPTGNQDRELNAFPLMVVDNRTDSGLGAQARKRADVVRWTPKWTVTQTGALPTDKQDRDQGRGEWTLGRPRFPLPERIVRPRAAREVTDLLEVDAVKLASPVPRGAGPSNGSGLPEPERRAASTAAWEPVGSKQQPPGPRPSCPTTRPRLRDWESVG